jgi:hypothetical protein
LLLALSKDNEKSTTTLISYLSKLAKYVPMLNKWNYVPS